MGGFNEAIAVWEVQVKTGSQNPLISTVRPNTLW
jgi:hypothetical protein